MFVFGVLVRSSVFSVQGFYVRGLERDEALKSPHRRTAVRFGSVEFVSAAGPNAELRTLELRTQNRNVAHELGTQNRERRTARIRTSAHSGSVFRVPGAVFVFGVPVRTFRVLGSASAFGPGVCHSLIAQQRLRRTPNLEPSNRELRTGTWNTNQEPGTKNTERCVGLAPWIVGRPTRAVNACHRVGDGTPNSEPRTENSEPERGTRTRNSEPRTQNGAV